MMLIVCTYVVVVFLLGVWIGYSVGKEDTMKGMFLFHNTAEEVAIVFRRAERLSEEVGVSIIYFEELGGE